MEVQLAVKTVRTGGGSPHHASADADTTTTTTKATSAAVVPNYLKPSTGSCHHVCKYGGTHTFHANDAPHKQPKPKARKQPPPRVQDQQRTKTPPPRVPDQQRTRTPPPLISRTRLVPRRLFGRGGRVKVQEEAAVVVNGGGEKQKKAGDGGENGVEWKDIVAYDTASVPSDHGPLAGHQQPDDKQSAHQPTTDGGAKCQKASSDNKKAVVKPLAHTAIIGPKPTATTVTGNNKASAEPPTRHKNKNTDDDANKGGVPKPPRGRGRGSTKNPAVSRKKPVVVADHAELVGGSDDAYQYQPLSPSLLQERANLLRDLEEEMTAAARESTTATTKAACYDSLHPEDYAAAAAEAETGSSSSSRRPVPAHRSRSVVRFPFTRQASKNNSSSTFKLRSKSSRGATATALPPPSSKEETKPPRTRSRRGSMGGDEVTGGGRGVQLRIRSLRRRGVGGGGTGSGGFVVPAVSLRHQKTLEKKRSQRLYNSVIEETASRLAKTRKSRVKALVGAFESVISRIAK